ncbi:MAG: hypothetical protein A3E83_05040 [Gammaproteobacteria bacterium RIFCSPHIGHO2_12_FULL_41_20]|nr:MAG: hypothetical protein A3E83_05040 [Gammaproteobacteria bacterium RIFCSPHIGHO2_12_FULL_41_20]
MAITRISPDLAYLIECSKESEYDLSARGLRYGLAMYAICALQEHDFDAFNAQLLFFSKRIDEQLPLAMNDFFNSLSFFDRRDVSPGLLADTERLVAQSENATTFVPDNIKELNGFSGIYTRAELEQYFSSLRRALSGCSYPVTLLLRTVDLAVAINFDTDKNCWTVVNADQLPGRELSTEQELISYLDSTLSADSLCAKNQVFTFSTQVYAEVSSVTDLNARLQSWQRYPEWIDMHSQQDEKHRLLGSAQLYMAARMGDVATVRALLQQGVVPDTGWLSPLAIAVQNHHTQVVTTLLQHGMDPDQTLPDGRTLTYIAARNGYADVIAELAKYKADLNQQLLTGDLAGATPLSVAVGLKWKDVVSVLLRLGADPNIALQSGETPLHLAVGDDDSEMVEILLTANAAMTPFPESNMTLAQLAVDMGCNQAARVLLQHGGDTISLFSAVLVGSVAVVKSLLALGVNPNQEQESDGMTPLALAAKAGNIAMMRLLLGYGADPYVILRDGNTLLGVAIKFDQDKAITFLLDEAKVNPDYPCFLSQEKPLHYAIRNGYSHAIKALVKAGVDVNQEDASGGMTPLCFAVKNGNVAAVNALLACGANPNQPQSDGSTPFSLAIAAKELGAQRLRIIERLAEAGIDLNQYLPNGDTALYSAVAQEDVELIRVLLAEGATADIPTRWQFTPLCGAVFSDNVDMIGALISGGANVNQGITEDNTTALMLAVEQNNMRAVNALLWYGADPQQLRKDGISALDIARQKGDRLLIEKLQEYTTPKSALPSFRLYDSSHNVYQSTREEERPRFLFWEDRTPDLSTHERIMRVKTAREEQAKVAEQQERVATQQRIVPRKPPPPPPPPSKPPLYNHGVQQKKPPPPPPPPQRPQPVDDASSPLLQRPPDADLLIGRLELVTKNLPDSTDRDATIKHLRELLERAEIMKQCYADYIHKQTTVETDIVQQHVDLVRVIQQAEEAIQQLKPPSP